MLVELLNTPDAAAAFHAPPPQLALLLMGQATTLHFSPGIDTQ